MQSHFVKLEPPYQIIHYGGEVGIQIGTLIVVGPNYPDPNFIDIRTHSHPVVSYVSKKLFRSVLANDNGDRALASYYGGGEGNVWSKVQVNDVDIIGIYDPEQDQTQYFFEWKDFVVLVSDGFSFIDAKAGSLRENGVLRLFDNLRKVGLCVPPASPVEHLEMCLSLSLIDCYDNRNFYTLFCQDRDGQIEFSIPFTGKTPAFVTKCLLHFIRQFLSLMKSLSATIEFTVGPTLGEEEKMAKNDISKDEENLKKLVKALNDNYNDKYRVQQP
jgi:hypothetical protein